MGFTKEQQLAIDCEGENIIVSAGAGSGKTAVLTERVIRKLKDGINVDRLLVLTFTNEAASEMKSRIRASIIKNNLNEQLDLLDSAYITTFDSYALSLVKKYHYLLNISNNIKIIDSSIITIYKYKLLDKIFEDMYGNPLFDKLINDFCLKDDISIKKFIIDASNKLEVLTNKEEYLMGYMDNYYSNEHINKLLNNYLKLIKNNITELSEIYHDFINYANDNLISKLDNYFSPLFNGKNYDEYVLFKTMPTVKFMGVDEAGLTIKEELKKKIDNIKELLRFDNQKEIKDSILLTKDYAEVILDIINKLDQEVFKYKQKHEIYEFNDISHMASKIVRDNLEIRNEIKAYFNEIMVDEYQDTSSIQEEFINYIANNNVYMVGDIKQSIYRFRNANPYIFRDKYNRYSLHDGGIKIDLLKNFRSRNETLFNINELFNLIMDEEIGDAAYLEDHNMVYGNTLYDNEDTKHNNYMDIYNYEMDEDDIYTKEEKELFIIAEDIINKINNKYQVFDKNTSKLRDLKYSDICIITDRNKYLVDYKKILEYKGIPSVIYMDQELSNDMVILVLKNLINLVYLVNNNTFDDQFRYVFTSVMRSFIFKYNDDEIYEILKEKKYYQNEIIKLCQEIDINQPIIDFINEIINKFKIYETLTILPNINENIIRIDNLTDIASNLSDIGYDIRDFITYLEDTNNLELGIKYSVGVTNSDAVKIMNIHKSKGLEFSLCYFTGMHNKFTVKETSSKFITSNEFGLILPFIKDSEEQNTIVKDLYVDDYFKKEISEKIRLFYVALTRSREKMIILANLGEIKDSYDKLVPTSVRLKYRSFLDILKSVRIIDKYVIPKEAKYDKGYDKVTLRDIQKEESNINIEKKEISLTYDKIESKKFSKNNSKLLDLNEIKKMEYGTNIHEVFEFDDFNNPSSTYVKNLLMQVPNNFINVYHEYEFIYNFNNEAFHGIIDLILEYDKYLYIIDYKLKNISDKEYIKQLNGYKAYIKTISNKDIKVYLYSVIDNNLTEVYDE